MGGGGGDGTRPVILLFTFTSLFALLVQLVRGTYTPQMAHSARWGWRISYVLACGGRFPLSLSTYLFKVNRRVDENKSINQSHVCMYILIVPL
jgi:hypothetical protein